MTRLYWTELQFYSSCTKASWGWEKSVWELLAITQWDLFGKLFAQPTISLKRALFYEIQQESVLAIPAKHTIYSLS